MRQTRLMLLVAGILAWATAGSADPSITITVSGTISGSPATISVNGISASISGSTFTATNVPVAFGANTITAVATDAAGNSSSYAITVHVGVSKTIQGTTTESVTSVTVNGIAASVSGMTFSASVPLQSGANTISVVATDAAGNQSTQTVDIYIVRTPVAHP